LKLFELFRNVTVHQAGPKQLAHTLLSSCPDPHPAASAHARQTAHPRLPAPGYCRLSVAHRSEPRTPPSFHAWLPPGPLFSAAAPPLKGDGHRCFPPFTLSLTRAISFQNDELGTSSGLFLDRLSTPPWSSPSPPPDSDQNAAVIPLFSERHHLGPSSLIE
jgi:hypothetical protein